MTIHAQFEQELTNLGRGKTAAVVCDAAPRKVLCDVVERNSLAVSFVRLELATTELAGASASVLARISKLLAERLTYLMEPISPIEVDAEECVVQLRSNPPHQDDDGRSYYELLVRRGGEITLVRYRKENGAARQQIPATVTREVLVRLVSDFSAVLDTAS